MRIFDHGYAYLAILRVYFRRCKVTAVSTVSNIDQVQGGKFAKKPFRMFLNVCSHFLKERSMHTVGGMKSRNHRPSWPLQQKPKSATALCTNVWPESSSAVAVWLASNTPRKGTRSVMMGVNGWANIAGVIASQLLKSKYRPRCQSDPR